MYESILFFTVNFLVMGNFKLKMIIFVRIFMVDLIGFCGLYRILFVKRKVEDLKF